MAFVVKSLAFAFATEAFGAFHRGNGFLAGNMRPEDAAHTFAEVEDEWRAQASMYTECTNTSEQIESDPLVDCSRAQKAFGKSCNTVVQSLVHGSSGDRDEVTEYLGDVCGQGELKGWRAQQCHHVADGIASLMTGDAFHNRQELKTDKLCTSLWSELVDDAKQNLAREQEQRQEEERRAAEAAEAERKVTEQKKKETEEAARRAAEEAKAKAEEAAKAKAEAEAKAKVENAAKVKVEKVEKAAKVHKAEKAAKAVTSKVEDASKPAKAKSEKAAKTEAKKPANAQPEKKAKATAQSKAQATTQAKVQAKVEEIRGSIKAQGKVEANNAKKEAMAKEAMAKPESVAKLPASAKQAAKPTAKQAKIVAPRLNSSGVSVKTAQPIKLVLPKKL